MRRRLAIAGLGILVGVLAGCNHNYQFVEIARGTPIYVNTSRLHYKIPINQEGLERQLILLARDRTSSLEEKFLFDVDKEKGYEIGFGEDSNKDRTQVKSSDSILREFAPGTKLIFYHIHPAGFEEYEMVPKLRDYIAEIVDLKKENKRLMEQLGKEIPPDIQKAAELELSPDELFYRYTMLPHLATPSDSDFGNYIGSLKKARKQGLNLRFMVASPFGITEIIVPDGDIIYNWREVLEMEKKYREFEKQAKAGRSTDMMIDPVRKYSELSDIADGYFAVFFRPAVGLPPYLHDAKLEAVK